MIHQKQAGVCQIIHIQEFTKGGACSPDNHLRLIFGLSLMETPNQSRKHMGMLRMVIIIGAVEIGGHHADIIRAILPVQVFTIFQPGNLGQGICLIGLFQGTGKKAALRHRLGSHSGVNAGTSQKHQLLHLIYKSTVNHIHFQNHIIVHKVSRMIAVGYDTAHFRCRQKYVLRFFLTKKLFHLLLIAKVQLRGCL